MLVQMQWKRVLRSSDYVAAIVFMLEDRVFGIEETFHFTDREDDFDPIFSRAVAQIRCFNPGIPQPIVNKFQCLVGGFHKLVDLIVSQMLATYDVSGEIISSTNAASPEWRCINVVILLWKKFELPLPKKMESTLLESLEWKFLNGWGAEVRCFDRLCFGRC
jgi:hypothetical protein